MSILNKFVDILTHRKTFWIFAILLFLYIVFGLIFIGKVGGDYWEHLATIYSYARDLVNPDNPYISSSDPTHLYTPYHLFWGAISQLINIHPYVLLPFIGGLNIILFIFASEKFSKYIIGDKKYATLMMITMLFFWFQPWGWSGFYHFGLLPLTSVYPYWFVLPLSILTIALYGEQKNNISLIYYILIFPIAFLIHPLTGSFLMIATVVKAFTFKNKSWKQKIPFLIIPPLSIVLSFLWPYYPVLDTILNSSKFSAIGFAGNYSMFYRYFIFKIFPALLGVPIIFVLLKKKEYFLPLGLFVFVSIYTLNYYILHSSTLARYIIFIAFFLQILIVVGIKELIAEKIFKPFFAMYIAILMVLIPLHFYSSLGQIGIVKSVLKKEPLNSQLNISIYKQFNNMRGYVTPQDIIIANMENSWRLPAILGCKVVGVLHSNPFLKDFFERKDDTNNFFKKETLVNTKIQTLKKYKVNYILCEREECKNIGLNNSTKKVYEDNEYILYKVLKQ